MSVCHPYQKYSINWYWYSVVFSNTCLYLILEPSTNNGVMSRIRGPFTPSQWMELEHQALIYKYIVANAPVPTTLLIPIRRSLAPAAFSPFSSFTSNPSKLCSADKESWYFQAPFQCINCAHKRQQKENLENLVQLVSKYTWSAYSGTYWYWHACIRSVHKSGKASRSLIKKKKKEKNKS